MDKTPGAKGEAKMAEFAPYSEAMERLLVVVQQLCVARRLDAVMEIVCHAAREITGADWATFVQREGDFCHYAEEDAISPLWKGRRFPISSCISGWTMLNRRPAVIEDIYADERIIADLYRPTFVKSLVMTPIGTDEPIGALGTYWADACRPPNDVVKVLQALAHYTSIAMEHAQRREESERRLEMQAAELAATNELLVEARERTESVLAGMVNDNNRIGV